MKKSMLLGIVSVMLLGTACGGGGDEPAAGGSPGGGGAPCSPSGTSLQIAAKNVKFDKDCLAAPADTDFTIRFNNDDQGVPHNVSIADGEHEFHGETITGPKTTTYSVGAMPAGEYSFVCDVHPAQMRGTFVVE